MALLKKARRTKRQERQQNQQIQGELIPIQYDKMKEKKDKDDDKPWYRQAPKVTSPVNLIRQVTLFHRHNNLLRGETAASLDCSGWRLHVRSVYASELA